MNKKLCPNCQTEIPDHSPGELCPRCVLCDADDESPNNISAPSLEKIAEAFPDWEVLSFIGQGGMGSVYEVHQPGLDRTAALKILSPELSTDPAFAERFAREARVMGKLKHPNIATIFESGEQGGYYYLLMEHIDGVNLRQAMRAGRFTPEQALTVIPGICDALQAAHAEGIWHRDIKPENILIDNNGIVKIVDFGIARLVGDPQKNFTLTMTGQALGSNAYMAPEQHEKPHEVDHRADIYSLGVVIYELLTGELPLGRFPSPGERSEVNARIDEIVLKTLEKERDLRQQSAQEVKTDLLGASIRKETSSKKDLSSSEESSTSFFQHPDKFFLTSIALWIGGLASILIGIYTTPVLVGLGCLATFFGCVGCWWILRRIRKEKHPVRHRLPLLTLVFWPCVCLLAIFPIQIWLVNIVGLGINPALLSQEWWSFSSALYAIAAIIVPLIISRVLWLFFAKRNGVTKLPKWRVVTAFVLIIGGMPLEQFVRDRTFERDHTYMVELELQQEGSWEDESHHFEKAVTDLLSTTNNNIQAKITPPKDTAIDIAYKTERAGKAILEWRTRHAVEASNIKRRCIDNLKASLHDSFDVTIIRDSNAYGSFDDSEKPLFFRTYIDLSLKTILIFIPFILMFLVTGSIASGFIWTSTSALIMSAILGLSNWPGLTQDAPPYIESVSDIRVVPEPTYKHHSTRDAVESLIEATKNGDTDAFESSFSPRIRKLIRISEGDISSMMKDWKSVKYAHQNKGNDELMNVFLKSKSGSKELHVNLTKSGRDWKIDSLLPVSRKDTALSKIERIIQAAKQKDRLRFLNGWNLNNMSAPDNPEEIDQGLEHIANWIILEEKSNPNSPNIHWIKIKVGPDAHTIVTLRKRNNLWEISDDPLPANMQINIEEEALDLITQFVDAAETENEQLFRNCLGSNLWQNNTVSKMKQYSKMRPTRYDTKENYIKVAFMEIDQGKKAIQTTLIMNLENRKWKFISEEIGAKWLDSIIETDVNQRNSGIETAALNVIYQLLDAASKGDEKLFRECLSMDILNNTTNIKATMQQFSHMEVTTYTTKKDKIHVNMKALNGKEGEVTFVMVIEGGKWKFSSEGH